MDVLILVGGFTVLCLLGMPVAYALGLSAILAAVWIDLPLARLEEAWRSLERLLA